MKDPDADIQMKNLIYLKIQIKSTAEPKYRNLNWDYEKKTDLA